MRKTRLSLLFTIPLIILALTACASPTPTPLQAPAFPTEDRHLDILRVSLEDAKAAYDSGSAIFVDVRSESSYAEAHIPGALSIPGTLLASRMGELDPGQWIITYCT
ncbi:MAG: rhodanese-like domain-containing protein [Chloroflexota bacterium]